VTNSQPGARLSPVPYRIISRAIRRGSVSTGRPPRPCANAAEVMIPSTSSPVCPDSTRSWTISEVLVASGYTA
jgi:hypothetical protein